MKAGEFVYAAQINTSRATFDRLGLDGMVKAIQRAADAAALDILIAGGDEIPSLYRAITGPKARKDRSVYLWYAVLSDNPEIQPEFQVVNFRGARSAGWGSQATRAEVGESFTFACPNHPALHAAAIARLERLLSEYPFDGVFLDKIRFPSPANGLEEVFSCFCPHCKALAAAEGLDLDAVQALLYRLTTGQQIPTGSQANRPQADWLSALLGELPAVDQEILAHFLCFRADSITRLVREIQALTTRMGVALSLDLFSPALATLVGQDYSALAGMAAWVKPMIYRFANGPAGLRLEIPQLVRGLANLLSIAPETAQGWMQQQIPDLSTTTLEEMEQEGVPPALILAELQGALECAGGAPLYLGVEAVSIPGFQIHITPDYVREMLSAARGMGAQGVVLSWDLLHMPLENLLVAQEGR